MIRLLLHNKTDDFFKFLENQKEECLIITPNPRIADLVRKRLHVESSAASITISKFMKDELSMLFALEELENYRGKSEILMLLGAIWKKLGAEANYIQFQKSFSLLTEFRSYSMNESVLETILENYSEKTAQAVLWSHRILENLNIIDEHKSYFMLAERLRSGDLPPNYIKERQLVFYGFDFVTASQLDLLKALSIRSDVLIPFYKDVYERSQGTDWVKWLEDFKCQIEDITQNEMSEIKANYTHFSKGYLAHTIAEYEKKYSFTHLLVGDKNISREIAQEIPVENLGLKISVDIFEDPYNKLTEQLRNKISVQSFDIEQFVNETQEYIKKYSEAKNFRMVKLNLLLLTKINEWKELSDEHLKLDDFDIEIILESLKLDLPRINLTTLSSNTQKYLHDLSGIESLKNDSVLFALSSAHSGFSGVGGQYSENVEKYLSSVGPIRRADFDLDIMHSKVKEFLSSNDVMMIFEKGLLEEDSRLNKVFRGILLELKEKISLPKVNKYITPLKIESSELKKLSASRLQSYKDCPRKYYLNYIGKLSPNIVMASQVSPMELGRMEHAIIEQFFKKYNEWSENGFKEIVMSEMKNLSESLAREEHQRVGIELTAYTQSAILNLLALKNSLDLNYEFEKPFQIENDGIIHSGSIDLYASNSTSAIILDFKRSARLFTSYESLMSYDQIQLWYYLERLKQLDILKDKNVSIGYIDLSDNQNSRLIGNDKEVLEIIKENTSFKNLKVVETWDDISTEYIDIEKRLIEKLDTDSHFYASPKDSNVCSFCAIRSVCDRGGF